MLKYVFFLFEIKVHFLHLDPDLETQLNASWIALACQYRAWSLLEN